MKQLFLLISFCIFVSAAHSQDFEEINPRTWTSVSGKTVEAELMSFKSGLVILKTVDSKTLRIPLSGLSAEDKEFIKQSQKPGFESSKPSASANPIKTVKQVHSEYLPTLANNRWTQFWNGNSRVSEPDGLIRKSYAVYKQPTFEARIGERGVLTIILLKDGKPMGRTMCVAHSVSKYEEEREGQNVKEFNAKQDDSGGRIVMSDGSPVYRKWEKFTSFPPPTDKPSTIVLKGIFEDNIPWECKYVFNKNTVSYVGKIRPPPNLKFPARYGIHCYIVPSHEFELTTSIEEQRKQTAHCSVDIEGGYDESETFGYTKSYSINQYFENLEVKGHYDPYTIKFHSTKHTRKAPYAYMYNYSGTALYNGFWIGSDQDYDESSGEFLRFEETPTVTITIESP